MRMLKWYLDLVAPGGTAFVAHWTRLQIGPIALHDGSILVRSSEGTIRRRTGRPGAAPSPASPESPESCARLPHLNDADSPDLSTIRWRSPALRLVGRWERRIAGRTVDLPAGRLGDVRWACLHAASDAEVTIDGITIGGPGYVERLELALPPWHLPITTLRWGRAVAEARAPVPTVAEGADPQSIVWIEWRGPVPYRLLLVDGVAMPAVDDVRIEDEHIRWPAHHLRLIDRGDPLDEPLDARLRAALGPFRRCLPARLRATRELRRFGTARLERAGPAAPSGGPTTVYGATWESVEFGPLGGRRRTP